MPFRCRLKREAEEDLAKLPKPLRRYVKRHLTRLADSPSALSIPSHFPYPEKCQLFHLPICKLSDTRHHLIVLFKYGQDERSLVIHGIGHSILGD
jgi:hypothetical protein